MTVGLTAGTIQNINRRFVDGLNASLFFQGAVPSSNVSGGTIITTHRFPAGTHSIPYGGNLVLPPGQSWTSTWDYKTSGEGSFRWLWWEEPAPG